MRIKPRIAESRAITSLSIILITDVGPNDLTTPQEKEIPKTKKVRKDLGKKQNLTLPTWFIRN